MKRYSIIAGMLILSLMHGPAPAERMDIGSGPPQVPQIEAVDREDRILILAPHPDDESLGVAGIIQKAARAGAQVKVAYLTNGEHNQIAFIVYEKRLVIKKKALIEMGELRQAEAVEAMKFLGVPEQNLIFLGYPDFGTLDIFLKYWGAAKPFKNLLNRVSQVPYEGALTPEALYKGESILRDIESVLKEYKPTKIFVTNPVDTNKDHRAYYLFLQVALWNLKGQIPSPKVYQYLIHCYGWPVPRHYHPGLYLPVPQQLRQSLIQWQMLPLSDEEVQRKYQAIRCYKSQRAQSAFYLDTFARKNELFGSYPVIALDKKTDVFERASTFRNKTVTYGRLGDRLFVNISFQGSSSSKSGFYIYLAPYNPVFDFAQMPKLKIRVTEDGARAYRFGKTVNIIGLQVEQKERAITLKIPLASLQNPEYILVSAGAHTSNYPSDLNAWRVVKLQ